MVMIMIIIANNVTYRTPLRATLKRPANFTSHPHPSAIVVAVEDGTGTLPAVSKVCVCIMCVHFIFLSHTAVAALFFDKQANSPVFGQINTDGLYVESYRVNIVKKIPLTSNCKSCVKSIYIRFGSKAFLARL